MFSEHFSCGALTFKCPGSYCIPLRRRCDEVNDCPGGEDEHECGKKIGLVSLKPL